MKNHQESDQPNGSSFAARAHQSKALIAIIAVLGVTVVAMGAALVANRSEAQATATPPVGQQAAAAPTSPSPPQAAMAPVLAPTAIAPAFAPAQAKTIQAQLAAEQSLPSVTNIAVCTTCGTVETVNTEVRQGKVNGVAVGNTTIGLGAVAGGVLGGVLGHQVGGGSGKTAMSILGAAGGAYAGNTVEKNMNKVTVYVVRVRMDNGKERRLEMSNSVPVGARVVVEGKNLRLAEHQGRG